MGTAESSRTAGVTGTCSCVDGEVLLTRRADNGRWTPVTGIVDPGEEPAIAAAREVLEETGVRARVDRLASTTAHPEITHANGDRAAYLDLTFACAWQRGRGPRRRRRVERGALVAARLPFPPMTDLMVGRIEAATSDEREARFVAPGGQDGPEPLVLLARSPAPVLGVDACPAGWVGVVLDPDRRASVFVAGSITELVGLVRETHDVVVVAVDIPIGLPDTSGRLADAEARRVLRGKSSSVFSTPVRAALEAASYEADGRPPGSDRRPHQRQRPGVRPAREDPAGRRMGPLAARSGGHRGASGGQLRADGGSAGAGPQEGRRRRRSPARRAREPRHRGAALVPGAGFGEDDLLDACASAWSAVRHSLGRSESFPEAPEVFSDGIPAAIWAWTRTW